MAEDEPNKQSGVFTREENLLKLLDKGCQSLVTAQVEFYETKVLDQPKWILMNSGLLCFTVFVKNDTRDALLQLYCPENNRIIWEQKLNRKLQYHCDNPLMHELKINHSTIAIKFFDEKKAQEMKICVKNEIGILRNQICEQMKVPENKCFDNQESSLMAQNKGTISLQNSKPHIDKRKPEANGKRNLTKEDISNPTDFVHLFHVGFDPEKPLDVSGQDDEALIQFLAKAGVSENDMKDPATKEFIEDFIETHGGKDGVQ